MFNVKFQMSNFKCLETPLAGIAHPTKSSRRGAAMLVVLFLVIGVAAISMGILYRSDMALAAGQNYVRRVQADYLAWAGLEYARGLVLANPAAPASELPIALALDNAFACSISRLELIDDAAYKTYAVRCSAAHFAGGADGAGSVLAAKIVYDPVEAKAWFVQIQR